MTQALPLGDSESQNHAHLLELACQGDGKAIATLMNRHLLRQQMVAQVEWEGSRLHVLIEAAQVPAPEPLFSVIYRTVLKLQVHTLTILKVSCRQVDSYQIDWSHEQPLPSNGTVNSDFSQQLVEPAPQPPVAPISLQDWLNQKAQASLTEIIQPISETNDVATELRFLRFSCSASETALLPLPSIRQVMKIQPQSLLAIPDMPAFVVGICNFHGEMLWMVDLGLQLGFQGASGEWDQLRSQPYVPAAVVPLGSTLMAIVIQSQGKSLGLIVPQLSDIESYDPGQLQPPPTDLFPSALLPFIQGYLVRFSSPVLDANALVTDRRLQAHAA